MLDFLNNSVLQFIINIILTVGMSAIIPIWIAFRQPILLPITYETISVKLVDDIEEIKKIKEKMQVSFNDDILKHPCLVTFKIQNSGRECIKLAEDSKPLIITFKKGVKVLGWDDLETVPSHVEVTPKLNMEYFLLVLPILNPKEAIQLRVLLSDYVDALPEEIDARIPAKKRIVRANNIRSSNENRIAAIVCLCMALLFIFYFLYSNFNINFSVINIIRITFMILIDALIAYASICYFQLSQIQRRMFPINFTLPSEILIVLLKSLLSGLPGLIIVGILAAAIYVLFGTKGLIISILVLYFLLACYLIIRDRCMKSLGKASYQREEERKM